MAFKFVVFACALAYANAGFLAPAVAPAIAYSAAPAVSTSYIRQASPLAVGPAPVISAYQAPAPLVSTYGAPAPLISTYGAPAPVISSYNSPAISSVQQNVLRSPLGGSISQYSKNLDTAFSSVRKFDTRITNDNLPYAVKQYAAPYAVAQPAPYALAQPAPYALAQPAPIAVAPAAPVLAKAAIAYSPAAVVSHVTFQGLGAAYEW